jgi:hypothetical protein
MTTKIVKEISSEKKLEDGDEVTIDQLKGLSGNMFLKVHIMDYGQIRPMDCSNPKPSDQKKNDTKTVYFEKSKLDAFFAENPDSDGLKIYFGVHDPTIYPSIRYPSYINKLMVVLVTTTGGKENLKVNDSVMIAGNKAGDGMDNGKLCPPDPSC